jgi:type III secretion protein U
MSDTGEEKTLPASAKKLRDARKKGQVPRSQDLVSAAGATAAIAYVWTRSGAITEQWREVLLLTASLQSETFPVALSQLVSALASLCLRTVLPLLAAATLAGILASIVATRGLVFSLQPLIPKIENLHPAQGLKRMFGLKSWIEFAKTVVKALLLGTALFVVLLGTWNTLVRVPVCGATCLGFVVESLTKLLLSIAVGAFVVAGLVDVLLQRWIFLRDMRMTPTEAKREFKEQEGNPQVRGAHHRLRQEAAAEPRLGVARATLIIVGGDAAAGLRYVRGETDVPLVVCRGRAETAAEIVQAATALAIPVVSDPGLAKALATRVRLGAPVPGKYFERIAKAFFAAGLVE